MPIMPILSTIAHSDHCDSESYFFLNLTFFRILFFFARQSCLFVAVSQSSIPPTHITPGLRNHGRRDPLERRCFGHPAVSHVCVEVHLTRGFRTSDPPTHPPCRPPAHPGSHPPSARPQSIQTDRWTVGWTVAPKSVLRTDACWHGPTYKHRHARSLSIHGSAPIPPHAPDSCTHTPHTQYTLAPRPPNLTHIHPRRTNTPPPYTHIHGLLPRGLQGAPPANRGVRGLWRNARE